MEEADLIMNCPTVFSDSIFILTDLLKPDRRQFFMNWLHSHSGQAIFNGNSALKCARNSLAEWFKSFPESRAIQEYELIISEIGWWRNLTEEAMSKILNEAESRIICLTLLQENGTEIRHEER